MIKKFTKFLQGFRKFKKLVFPSSIIQGKILKSSVFLEQYMYNLKRGMCLKFSLNYGEE